jgi:hypothetical protein
MIKYTLICEKEHGFDAWFDSVAGYERQADASQVTCPSCGSAKVRKAVMTPNIATGTRRAAPPSDAISPEGLATLRAMRQHVVSNADYVGPRFAEEARKIHYGEIEARGIYGEASPAEARKLIEDGVQVAPLPKLPEDHN